MRPYLLEPNRQQYYVSKQNQLQSLGMKDPFSDTDKRQRQIWQYIIDNNLSINLELNYDFASNLADHSSPFYKFSQSRSECERS